MFLEHTGDFTGAVSLGTELKDQPDIRRGFLVHIQVSILIAEIAVGSLRGNALTRHSLVAEYSANLLARVLGIPFVDDIPKRREIVILAFAVYAIIDSDEAHAHFGKAYLRIHSDLKIITAKA